MKVVYTQDQKREALALARREGIPAASRHYGVAKNTIYRWKAAMELNGLLEEDTVQENTTGELNETAEDTAHTAPTMLPGETEPVNPLNDPGHDADSSAESEKQPQPENRDMRGSAENHLPAALQLPQPSADNAQAEDYISRNQRLCANATSNSPEILFMILDENARLYRENQQLRRAMRALVEL